MHFFCRKCTQHMHLPLYKVTNLANDPSNLALMHCLFPCPTREFPHCLKNTRELTAPNHHVNPSLAPFCHPGRRPFDVCCSIGEGGRGGEVTVKVARGGD
jgi:hypothetical protein